VPQPEQAKWSAETAAYMRALAEVLQKEKGIELPLELLPGFDKPKEESEDQLFKAMQQARHQHGQIEAKLRKSDKEVEKAKEQLQEAEERQQALSAELDVASTRLAEAKVAFGCASARSGVKVVDVSSKQGLEEDSKKDEDMDVDAEEVLLQKRFAEAKAQLEEKQKQNAGKKRKLAAQSVEERLPDGSGKAKVGEGAEEIGLALAAETLAQARRLAEEALAKAAAVPSDPMEDLELAGSGSQG